MANFFFIEVGYFLIISTLVPVMCRYCSSNRNCYCYKVNGELHANCENLHLTSAPAFGNDVMWISLANNNLSIFPNNLPLGVVLLNISRNCLRKIDQQSLEKYRQLRTLKISKNLLQTIEMGSFKNSSNLVDLDISGNQELTLEVVANISSDLRNSTSIRVLNFEKLQCTYGVSFIVKRYHTAYLKHTHLEELNLASNRINSLEFGVLSELPKSLKHLNLNDNKLSFGFYLVEFGDLSNIVTVSASFQSSFHQKKLREFIKGCNDTRPVSATWSANKFWDSDRQNRFLSSLSRPSNITIFLPSTLQTLYFHDNLYKMTLQDYTFNFTGEPRWSEIYMQNNIIYQMNGPMIGMRSVSYANFSNNFCSYISPRFFEDFRNLSCLDFSQNALGANLENDIDGEIFQNLCLLKTLDLSQNRVLRLPAKIFRNLKQLETLKLSDNSLSEFTVPIDHMVHLTNLDLSNNQLSTLNTETRKALDAISQRNLVSVNLEGNNLRCDCEDMDFLKWMMKSKKVVFLHLDNYLCTFSNFSRIRLSNVELFQLMEKQCSSYSLIIVMMTSLIIVLLTITISRILYRYRWKLRYMYYVAWEKHKNDIQRSDALEDQYHFDAFASYADKDRSFVIELVKRLEKDFNLRLCIHHRDFIPGTGIADNITNAIHYSRKTVCVITSHFLQSYWCMFELNMARMEAIYSRNGENVLFLVALEKGAMKKLPFSFMDLIDSKSYIEFPEDGDEDEETAFRSKLGDTILSHENDFKSFSTEIAMIRNR